MDGSDDCMLEIDGDDTRALTVREFNRRVRLFQRQHYRRVWDAIEERKVHDAKKAEILLELSKRIDAIQDTVERYYDRWLTLLKIIGGLGVIVGFLFSSAGGIVKLLKFAVQ